MKPSIHIATHGYRLQNEIKLTAYGKITQAKRATSTTRITKNKTRARSTPRPSETYHKKVCGNCGKGGRRREQAGKGCGSAAARAHRADSDAECRRRFPGLRRLLRAMAVLLEGEMPREKLQERRGDCSRSLSLTAERWNSVEMTRRRPVFRKKGNK